MEVSEPLATSKVSYKTTRPTVPLTSERLPFDVRINQDLVVQLRPFDVADLEYIYRLRTQEVVMVQTAKGSIDLNIEESQKWMDRYLPPNDSKTYNYMLWAKDGIEPWEHIGVIGSHVMSPVPLIGYMIRSEWWGKSIVTKALTAFLEHWWALPRQIVQVSATEVDNEDGKHFIELELNRGESRTGSNGTVTEIILAEIEENNIGSIRVITKCGFKYRGQKTIEERGQTFTLHEYTLARPNP